MAIDNLHELACDSGHSRGPSPEYPSRYRISPDRRLAGETGRLPTFVASEPQPRRSWGRSSASEQTSQRGRRAGKRAGHGGSADGSNRPTRQRGTDLHQVLLDLLRRRPRASPSLRASRLTCVSTTTPDAIPNAVPRTTLAVFRPTPGSAVSASRSRECSRHGPPQPCGPSPASFATWPGKTRSNESALRARLARLPPGAPQSGNRRKSSGVTMFTRASVHCAERIVATRS